MGKKLTNEQRDTFITEHLVFGRTAQDIGRKHGVSGGAVSQTITVFAAVKERDWDCVIKKCTDGRVGINVVEWACDSLGIRVPENVLKAIKNEKEPPVVKTVAPVPVVEPVPIRTLRPGLYGILAEPMGTSIVCTPYRDGNEIQRCRVSLRRDISDKNLQFAQAMSYGAHMMFKFEQQRSATDGEYFDYQFRS